MTHKTRILALLASTRPGDRCDDCLSEELDIRPRQTVNIACRPLQEAGAILRLKDVCSRCGKRKLVNRLEAGADHPAEGGPAIGSGAFGQDPPVGRPSIARGAAAATNHQRVGAVSNAHAGRDFEQLAQAHFERTEGLALRTSFALELGHGPATKRHRFDLGNDDPAILVECKSHAWTVSGNMPSAKVTVWNEAMYYFLLAPVHYRKVLFVLHARHARQGLSLAQWYVKTNRHLIPAGVEIIEFDTATGQARRVL